MDYQHPEFAVTEIVVSQSSDASYHCTVISIFCWEDVAGSR